jgi:hypothetical protein
MAPWCLLTRALTLATISTKTRLDLLEIGFWFLWLHSRLKRACSHPHGVCEQIHGGPLATLYTSRQVCDALNTLVSLMTVIRDSPTPIRLNHLGSNPLEHAFGKARIPCFDVNAMRRMMRSFTSEALSLSVNTSLQIVSAPRPRCSLGVDRELIYESDLSAFTSSPKTIVVSLFHQTRINFTPLQLNSNLMQQHAPPLWCELFLIPEFIPAAHRPRLSPETHVGPMPKKPRSILSSGQIFLDIVQSPRVTYLITAHEQIVRALDEPLVNVEQQLNTLHGRCLSAHDLISRVSVVAREIDERAPGSRRRGDCLAWFRDHLERTEPVIPRLIPCPPSLE